MSLLDGVLDSVIGAKVPCRNGFSGSHRAALSRRFGLANGWG